MPLAIFDVYLKKNIKSLTDLKFNFLTSKDIQAPVLPAFILAYFLILNGTPLSDCPDRVTAKERLLELEKLLIATFKGLSGRITPPTTIKTGLMQLKK